MPLSDPLDPRADVELALLALLVAGLLVAGVAGALLVSETGLPWETDDRDDPGPTDNSSPPLYGTAGQTWTVTVTAVVDGDTIDIAFQNGSTDTVRLLGIDTPEVHSSVEPDQYEGISDTTASRECLERVGEAATASVRDRVAGETVTVHADARADRRGYYDRLLGYLMWNGSDVNHDLVTDGYARVYDSTFSLSDRFYAAEESARAAERRVWGC